MHSRGAPSILTHLRRTRTTRCTTALRRLPCRRSTSRRRPRPMRRSRLRRGKTLPVSRPPRSARRVMVRLMCCRRPWPTLGPRLRPGRDPLSKSRSRKLTRIDMTVSRRHRLRRSTPSSVRRKPIARYRKTGTGSRILSARNRTRATCSLSPHRPGRSRPFSLRRSVTHRRAWWAAPLRSQQWR